MLLPYRRLALAAILATAALTARAQTGGVGIGTTTPDLSAALDIVSSSQGVLLPRVASTADVANPAPGLLVYQTSAPAGFYYNAGPAGGPADWRQLAANGAGDFIRNQTTPQAGSSFNVSGSGTIGGTATAGQLGVGTGTDTPRGLLDVAGSGDSYLVADPANGNAQTLYLPGHLFLAPYSAAVPNAYIQARVPGPTAGTSLGLRFRTTSAGSLVEAFGLAANGTPQFATLAGTGTRMVVTAADGTLTAQALPAAPAIWSLTGNAGTTAGTNFLGTTDNVPLELRTNSATLSRLRLRTDGGVDLGNANTFNVSLGYNTGSPVTGQLNTFIGGQAGRDISGGVRNFFGGVDAGLSNNSGSDNTAVGASAGSANQGGTYNTFVGSTTGGSNQSGVRNTFLGYQARTGTPNLSNATAIGAEAIVNQSNALVLGGTGTYAVSVGIGTGTPSSTLHVVGAVAVPYANTGNATTFTLDNTHQTVRRYGSCTTITLPAPGTCPGRLYTLLNSVGSSVTLTVSGGGSVYDDVAAAAVTTLPGNQRLTVQSAGSTEGWLVVGR